MIGDPLAPALPRCRLCRPRIEWQHWLPTMIVIALTWGMGTMP